MRRWAAAALGGAVALAALPACGGKTDEAVRAAGVTPADAVAFFSVNLAPSIEQQRNLRSIVERFPGAAEEVQGSFEEARDDLLAELAGEAGLDYGADVAPWLGNEVALAILPLPEGESVFGGGEPTVVLLFETDDGDQATAAVDKAAANGSFDGSARVVDDFLVVVDHADEAAETAALDKVEAAAGGRALAASDAFTSVVGELAGDRLLLAWADGGALARTLAGGGGGGPGAGLFGFADSVGDGPVAADLHAERAALVLQGVSAAGSGEGGGEPALTAGLPADVLGALTLFDVRGAVERGLRLVAGFAGTGLLDGFEEATGVDIRGDVLSWMEGELVVVAGPVAARGSFPEVAAVVEPTDAARAEAGLAKVVAALEANGLPLARREVAGATAYVAPVPVADGVQPAMALFEDRFVVASSIAFLERLAADASPSLGASDQYRDVVGEGSRDGTSFQFVARIDPIREAIEAALTPRERADFEREAKANVEPLDALGVSARRDGERFRFELRLTFD